MPKGAKLSHSDCKKGKGHAMYDECPSYDGLASYDGHPSLTSYHLMGKTHIIWENPSYDGHSA